jgi:GMP synthase (glutamine-hydrolysing)
MMIAIIDNGGQYTHLIWRTCRDLGHEARIAGNKSAFADVADASAFIISGGPGSAYSDDFGVCREVIERCAAGSTPLLGICMGHQLIAHVLGGKVARGRTAEYGIMSIEVDDENALFAGVPKRFNAWVSHFDEVKHLPAHFRPLAHSAICSAEAMAHEDKPIYGVQFHPEVWHTEHGETMFKNFLGI